MKKLPAFPSQCVFSILVMGCSSTSSYKSYLNVKSFFCYGIGQNVFFLKPKRAVGDGNFSLHQQINCQVITKLPLGKWAEVQNDRRGRGLNLLLRMWLYHYYYYQTCYHYFHVTIMIAITIIIFIIIIIIIITIIIVFILAYESILMRPW